mmetsp:Transcript_16911/g.40440  ORF Transcript_16911/g.40440 Transcript_16911/m.40440 type:complete len:388 (-) Transcript_16911:1421-2584(-)
MISMPKSRKFSTTQLWFFMAILLVALELKEVARSVDNQNKKIPEDVEIDVIEEKVAVTATYKHPNVNKLDKITKCTKDQMTVIESQLGFLNGCRIGKPSYFCPIAHKTRCPDNSWLQDHFRNEFKSRKSFVGISIGCNKGYDAINTARMGMNNPSFDKSLWDKEIITKLPTGANANGACNQRNDPQFDILPDEPVRPGEMHCVEPVPRTAQILSNSTKNLGLDKGKSIFEVTKAAISSADGTVEFSTNVKNGGGESTSIGVSCGEDCEEVPMYSLQTYVDKFVQSKTNPINVLSVDVEGFDFDVLFGAGSVLDRTEYIEFEFHDKGNWKNYHIMDAINLLNGKGFTCYWASEQKLWRLTECHHDVYNHWHGWSNVACVHRSQKVFIQ